MDKKLLPRDSSGHVIQAGSGFYILNIDATSSDWTPITLPADVDSKNVTIKARKSVSFKLANEPNGDYMTVHRVISLNVVAQAGDIIGYVKPKVNTTIEVLVLA